MVRTFERGLSQPSGFVLPIQRWNARGARPALEKRAAGNCGAASCFLSPGDSPVGLRLPLGSAALACRRIGLSLCPSAGPDRAATAAADARRARQMHYDAAGRSADADAGPPDPHRQQATSSGAVRTALSIEPRDGVLCVFMPPVERLEDYLELIAAIERTRARDRRTGSYRRLSAAVRSAHRRDQGDARSRRDRGQHSSGRRTGGRRSTTTTAILRRRAAVAARHRQVHARRPACRHRRRQSCGARRRDARGLAVPAPARSVDEPGALLAAPSVAVLSVLRVCSSVRPARRRAWTRRGTTASTRLEIALDRCRSRRGDHVRPGWSTGCSAICLADVTGNTHRAEICIDKLYSPDGPTGRLGLIEFRSFEMPPDPRMSLAQQLLTARAGRVVLARAAVRQAGALGHGAA